MSFKIHNDINCCKLLFLLLPHVINIKVQQLNVNFAIREGPCRVMKQSSVIEIHITHTHEDFPPVGTTFQLVKIYYWKKNKEIMSQKFSWVTVWDAAFYHSLIILGFTNLWWGSNMWLFHQKCNIHILYHFQTNWHMTL